MSESETGDDGLSRPLGQFRQALDRLEGSPRLARRNHINRFLQAAWRLLTRPGGVEAAYGAAARFDGAGVFTGTDWDHPDRLQANFVPTTLARGDRLVVTLEALSQLRLLAIARGDLARAGLSAEAAGHYLREVLAFSLEHVFERRTEASRAEEHRLAGARAVLRFVAESVGYDTLLEQLVEEIRRLLRQRPIHVEPIRAMIERLAGYCYEPSEELQAMPAGAERLISSLNSPSPSCHDSPSLEVYGERLGGLDQRRLQEEANACARSMYDTGLASRYHAVLLRFLLDSRPELLGAALGLSTTGLDSYLTYRDLVHALIERAIHPETCQAIYGLSALLERAILHAPSVATSLWRQLHVDLCDGARDRLETVCGTALSAEAQLLAGAVSLLGQPLGVGQGDNPTCQSARALSLWAYSDPDYLLQLITRAGRDDSIAINWQGEPIRSGELAEGTAGPMRGALDPVSVVLVPHLDRIYSEMYRRADNERDDPHEAVNPAFHGWRVGRGFAIAVDVPSGRLWRHEAFVRLFYACYHPAYNGGSPVVHPQPIGLAVTDALARFVGWHAVSLLRVALDLDGVTRVYFFNPNNDKGQNWGNDVVVSTEGHGERPGESSLSMTHFVSRLYLFHYDTLEVGDPAAVPAVEVTEVQRLAAESWGAGRDRSSDATPEREPAESSEQVPAKGEADS